MYMDNIAKYVYQKQTFRSYDFQYVLFKSCKSFNVTSITFNIKMNKFIYLFGTITVN